MISKYNIGEIYRLKRCDKNNTDGNTNLNNVDDNEMRLRVHL